MDVSEVETYHGDLVARAAVTDFGNRIMNGSKYVYILWKITVNFTVMISHSFWSFGYCSVYLRHTFHCRFPNFLGLIDFQHVTLMNILEPSHYTRYNSQSCYFRFHVSVYYILLILQSWQLSHDDMCLGKCDVQNSQAQGLFASCQKYSMPILDNFCGMSCH